jgi:diguanylate cyclase (GGDEF)-like protein
MSSPASLSFRRNIGLVVVVLCIFVGGTWQTVKFTTDYLLYQDATFAARDWAKFLATSVVDLEQIASGEQPSAASMAFFEAIRRSDDVFRYEIFNRDGYSQLVSDRDKIALVDVSEFSSEAARAVATGRPVVDAKHGDAAGLPSFFALAFVPVMIDHRAIGVVGTFVDQTEVHDIFQKAFLITTILLCGLIGLAFSIPAIAWYRRTIEKQQADRRIRFLAKHDVLTGLSNRADFIEKLERTLATLPQRGDNLAVYFVDIDRFKEVNDTFGHDGGDFLLKTIGDRLLAGSRVDDAVARFGGDEFVLVQRGLTGRIAAEAFASRVAAAMAAPVLFKNQEVRVTVSVGVAMAPCDGNSPDRLLKCADLALYKSKADGRNCVRFFVPEMDAALAARAKVEKAIRDAVQSDGFLLHYQPVFDVASQRLTGFEALIRLPASDGTLIPPMEFIPLAEEIRLIDRIGAWVLREACRAAAAWPEHLTVAVNLSPSQFETGSVSEIVAAALDDAGLASHRLELEITESLLLGNTDAIMVELRRLKAMGVAIVMDDFGTGYSSLSYLWRFPFNKIKIDRSFMQGFDNPGRDAEKVVKTIIALGRELRMEVTVEGVETANQAAFIDKADVDQVQGFFFGHPGPAADVATTILADYQRFLQPQSGSVVDETQSRLVEAATAMGP